MTERVGPLSDAVTSLVEIAERQDDPRLQRYAALTRTRLAPLDDVADELRAAASVAAPAVATRAGTDLRSVVERAEGAVRAVTRTDELETTITPVPLTVACDLCASSARSPTSSSPPCTTRRQAHPWR